MIEVIKHRLQRYNPLNALEEEQAIKEIVQEIALFALWQADFFKVAAFHGGTCLRILYDLPRFSEDLDFILKKPSDNFEWEHYLTRLVASLADFGLHSEVVDKSRMDRRIKKAIIKNSSITNQLDLSFYSGPADQKLKIKLEIDVNPPAHSHFDYTFFDFPSDFEIYHQDLPSNFALKIHALLCRGFVKGRDWFDFSWYIRQGTQPNISHLEAALIQYGPWEGQAIQVDRDWLIQVLAEKVVSIDWPKVTSDVERFLNVHERKGLELWSEKFFLAKVKAIDEKEI